ncbi:hypothetical protein F0919_17735 [Taibaiella lutea]|uniref:Uncharacterized protein n=1 Tax=Taibaiella lutea TaxID=2608001 RepID=A0A5M6CCA4_9BACT|nr:hypothetical protein [Taibaiella lutea]KAA5532623.1 hypothetical protein F0919_17735 [Taibaiella lutea]
MQKTITYAEHEIKLKVDLNTGTKIVNEENVLTSTLSAQIDGTDFVSKSDLSDNEVIAAIPAVQAQAQARIDIMGTPNDSPLANQLIEMGFEFEI